VAALTCKKRPNPEDALAAEDDHQDADDDQKRHGYGYRFGYRPSVDE
jgi:hypothetical protein